MRVQKEWLDAEGALRELHADASCFERWQDEEQFVADMMEFAQAAYAGGYEDALDDLRELADKLSSRLDDSLAEQDVAR